MAIREDLKEKVLSDMDIARKKRESINEKCIVDLMVALENYLYCIPHDDKDAELNALLIQVYGKHMANKIDGKVIRKRFAEFE